MGDVQTKIIQLIVIFGSIALHEFGHAKSADAAGDSTPRLQGRVTLNPFAHFDPFGSLMIFVTVITGFGIGWGKPVQVDPRQMQNPRLDGFISVLWGPLTNVIIAAVFAAIFRLSGGFQHGPVEIFGSGVSYLSAFAFFAVILNVGLALFNLIPIGPLDGHWLLGYILPQPLGARYMIWSRTTGTLILLGAILLIDPMLRSQQQPGLLDMILFRPMMNITMFLLGPNLLG